jgi:hypothetical protein
MPTTVTLQPCQTARREIVRQVELGASVQVVRVRSAVSMHRTTVYRLRVSRAARRRTGVT